MTTEQDMKLRHYQPAGRTSVCGAKMRVVALCEKGLLEKGSVLRVPSTSDVRKVTCPDCVKWIAGWVEYLEKEMKL